MRAFMGCTKLTEAIIPDSVTYIGAQAFYGCNQLTKVKISKGLTYLGSYAFLGCNKLTEFIVDEDNTKFNSVDGVLFNKDGTTLLEFPAGKAGVYTVPSGVTKIDDGAFYCCLKLTKVIMPSS